MNCAETPRIRDYLLLGQPDLQQDIHSIKKLTPVPMWKLIIERHCKSVEDRKEEKNITFMSDRDSLH